MIQLKTKHKGNQLTITHKLNQKEQVAHLEQSLIEQGEIPELQPVTIHNGLFGIRMQFILSDCISLPEYLAAGIPLEQFSKCLLEIIHIIQECESHGISISNLEVRPEYIYYDVTRQRIRMLYWPIHSVKEYPDIRGLFQNMMDQYAYRNDERDMFFRMTGPLGKREKLDLLEWEKMISLCTGISRTRQQEYCLYHITKQRWISLKQYPFSIGRQPGACNYAVDDSLVSRCHCTLLMRNGQICIRDNNSANGTRVEGHLLERGREYILQNKNQIVIGKQRFQFFTEIQNTR